MSESRAEWSKTFASASADVADIYDRTLIPGFFTPWTHLLLDRIAPKPGEAALDVATGTAVVARELAARVGADGRVVGADLSPGMLAVARSKPPVASGAQIEFVESPAAPLAVESDAFDIAICHHGFQFFPDKLAAFAEMRRALRAGGRLGVAVWGEVDEIPVFAVLRDMLVETVGAEVASRYLVPFSQDGNDLAALAEKAGFENVRHSHDHLPVEFPAGMDLIESLKVTGIAQEWAAVDPDVKRVAIDRATQRYAAMTEGDKIRCGSASNLITASA